MNLIPEASLLGVVDPASLLPSPSPSTTNSLAASANPPPSLARRVKFELRNLGRAGDEGVFGVGPESTPEELCDDERERYDGVGLADRGDVDRCSVPGTLSVSLGGVVVEGVDVPEPEAVPDPDADEGRGPERAASVAGSGGGTIAASAVLPVTRCIAAANGILRPTLGRTLAASLARRLASSLACFAAARAASGPASFGFRWSWRGPYFVTMGASVASRASSREVARMRGDDEEVVFEGRFGDRD